MQLRCLVWSGLLAVMGWADEIEERHRKDLAAQPADLQLRLSVGDGVKRVYRPGERIPIVLSFSSATTAKYRVNVATFDRSGRVPSEEFVRDEGVAGAVDPYVDYFGAGVLAFLGGGPGGSGVLAGEPIHVQLTLNDWLRFDAPGRYRLYLKSHRVSRERLPKDEPGEQSRILLPAVSNMVEIEIAARDSAREASKVDELRRILLSRPILPGLIMPGMPKNFRIEPPPSEDVQNARADLRYLATPGAVDVAMQEARREGRMSDAMLLCASRDRKHALAALDRFLEDDNVAITEWGVRFRAFFRYIETERVKPLPQLLSQMKEAGGLDAVQREAERRREEFKPILRAEAVRWIPAAAAKRDAEVRERSAEAIAAIAPEEAKAAKLVPPDDYGMSRAELVAAFAEMPEKQQTDLLSGQKWDLIRGKDMAGPLRQALSRVKRGGELPGNALHIGIWGSGGVGGTLLRRLFEIAPGDAEDLVIADLARGETRFANFAVLQIRGREAPEADASFRRWIEAGNGGALPLVAKFGSPNLGGAMRKLYGERSWPCAEEAAFLAYFARVLPGDVASEYLRNAREQRGCYWTLFADLARFGWSATLEAEVVAALGGSHAETVASAATVLGANGSPQVEGALWQRLERAVSAKEDERMVDALFHALGSGKAWVLDVKRRERLAGLCADPECVRCWKSPGVQPLLIDASNGGDLYPVVFRVDGYATGSFEELKLRLGRYPAGTAFRWCPRVGSAFEDFSPGQRDDMYKELVADAAKRSQIVEPYAAAKCGER